MKKTLKIKVVNDGDRKPIKGDLVAFTDGFWKDKYTIITGDVMIDSIMKPVRLIIVSDDKIKENTNTFNQGLNGDWFWCPKYNEIACNGDITTFDFKIIGSYPHLDRTYKLSKEFIEEWTKNPVEEIEVEYIPIHAIDRDGFAIPYAFEKDDKLVYDVKLSENNELICNIPETTPIKIQASGLYGTFGESKLDLDLLEEKLDDAMENETPESLSDWLLSERIKDSAQNYYIEECEGEPLYQDTPVEAYIAGAKSEAAKNYWLDKLNSK